MPEIVDELASLRRRIEAIAAGPRVAAPQFGAAVDETLARQHERTAPASRAPRATIDRLVAANAAAFQIDPALIAAIVQNESGFDANATSSAGARGLMQLMPQTAASLGVSDSYDPAQNVRGGTRYLRGLLDRFGDVELAVAAYNAGPSAVARYGGVPPYAQTQDYVRKVMARYRQLREDDE
jgi:soluble lytic murein transglycosylase-like protein